MRVANWEDILYQEVAKAAHQPFEWSLHDCVTWAFSVRALITGKDATPLWKGSYGSAAASYKKMKSLGFSNLVEVADHFLGDRQGAAFSQRGDIVFLDQEEGGSLAVCIGTTVATLSPQLGYTTLPLSYSQYSWRVN